MYVEETGDICRIITHSSTIKTEKLNAGGIAVSVGTAVVAREGGGGQGKVLDAESRILIRDFLVASYSKMRVTCM